MSGLILTFANHVCNICKTWCIQMQDLRQVREYLMNEAAIPVANVLVISCLDYCNSLFISQSSLNMRKMQYIKKTLGSIVTNILTGISYIQITSRAIYYKHHWEVIVTELLHFCCTLNQVEMLEKSLTKN